MSPLECSPGGSIVTGEDAHGNHVQSSPRTFHSPDQLRLVPLDAPEEHFFSGSPTEPLSPVGENIYIDTPGRENKSFTANGEENMVYGASSRHVRRRRPLEAFLASSGTDENYDPKGKSRVDSSLTSLHFQLNDHSRNNGIHFDSDTPITNLFMQSLGISFDSPRNASCPQTPTHIPPLILAPEGSVFQNLVGGEGVPGSSLENPNNYGPSHKHGRGTTPPSHESHSPKRPRLEGDFLMENSENCWEEPVDEEIQPEEGPENFWDPDAWRQWSQGVDDAITGIFNELGYSNSRLQTLNLDLIQMH